MLIKSYVDIFITFTSHNKFKKFTDYINHQDSSTKFTFEDE